MLYLGLSGGIGSGKSTVSRRLTELGARVIDADILAREVVEPGSAGLAAIEQEFGSEVLLPEGGLNRPALGAIVFADETARRRLEAITHPLIAARTADLRAAAPDGSIVVHDMPLLVEKQLMPDYHLVVIVDTDAEVRVERLVRDRGMREQDARARIAAQATDDERHAAADVLLANHGQVHQLAQQVDALWRERLAPYNDNLLHDRGVRRPSLVHIEDPDPTWPATAARSIARLRRQLDLSGLGERVDGVEHIGSTSVPGLAAKDVIDLQLAVDDLALIDDPRFRAALRSAGFVAPRWSQDTVHPWAPDPEDWGKGYALGADPAVVSHLHIRRSGSPGVEAALTFRDWLRANPAEAAAYATLKHRLAAAHPGGGEAARHDYPESKEPWMAQALLRARAWSRGR